MDLESSPEPYMKAGPAPCCQPGWSLWALVCPPQALCPVLKTSLPPWKRTTLAPGRADPDGWPVPSLRVCCQAWPRPRSVQPQCPWWFLPQQVLEGRGQSFTVGRLGALGWCWGRLRDCDCAHTPSCALSPATMVSFVLCVRDCKIKREDAGPLPDGDMGEGRAPG